MVVIGRARWQRTTALSCRGEGRCRRCGSYTLHAALAQRAGRVRGAQLGERHHLELADTLARDAQLLADFQQRATAAVADAVAQDHDGALAGGKLRKRAVELFAEQMARG